MMKDLGIAEAAHEVAANGGPKCSEGILRRVEGIGVVTPKRDPWGRRLYSQADIAAVRAHLLQREQIAAA